MKVKPVHIGFGDSGFTIYAVAEKAPEGTTCIDLTLAPSARHAHAELRRAAKTREIGRAIEHASGASDTDDTANVDAPARRPPRPSRPRSTRSRSRRRR
jgi:hypothetical protein